MDDWLEHALLYVERFRLSVIPMGTNKRPLIPWKALQSRRPTREELERWPRQNLAIVTGQISNIVVVDCEARDDAEWFWRHRGKSEVVCRTRRGFHLYFRHPGEHVKNAQRVDGRYDVRGDGGYVLAPPSRHRDGRYEWVMPMIDTMKLAPFCLAWRPAATYEEKDVQHARKYISKITAVSGEGGHSDTYRAVCILRGAGFSEAEALLAMQQWNRTNASPMWTDQELLHKVRCAYAV